METPAAFSELRGGKGFAATLEWQGSAGSYLLGLRPYTFALYTGAGAAFHFDLEGRLRRAFVPEAGERGTHYLRGLDGHLLRKKLADEEEAGERLSDSSPLGPEQRRALFQEAHRTVQGALQSFPGAGPAPQGAGEGGAGEREAARARELLERAAAYDPDRLEREARRFLEAYRPLGILPPDQYHALILQATEGCAYNSCTFCNLYRGSRYRVKAPEEFREHVRRVKAFLGQALPLRQGIFLGEANALAVPQPALLKIFAVLREEVPEFLGLPPPPGGRPAAVSQFSKKLCGVAAFMDAFTVRDKEAGEFEELARLGLRRVYLGVESGDEDLLRFLRKPASNENVQRFVEDLKRAGLFAGVIILVGAGGYRYGESHVEKTVELANRLPLGEGDLIFLSPLVITPGSEYESRAREEGILHLRPQDLKAQEAELLRRLRPPEREGRDHPAAAGRCPAQLRRPEERAPGGSLRGPPRDQAPSGLGARARQRGDEGASGPQVTRYHVKNFVYY
ncbi:MAG: radical SAM protein [Planctomycetes bacterium]|nr:radical SAM protein [Planctomycetota bacterium]